MASERPEPEVRGGRAQLWSLRSEGEDAAVTRCRGLLQVWGRPDRVAWVGDRPSPDGPSIEPLPRGPQFLLGARGETRHFVLFTEISFT